MCWCVSNSGISASNNEGAYSDMPEKGVVIEYVLVCVSNRVCWCVSDGASRGHVSVDYECVLLMNQEDMCICVVCSTYPRSVLTP